MKIDFDIKPIETKKRYALVIDQILDLIRGGAFTAGDKLPPERTMAAKLGVSRPSVREAYCVLEIVGILESRAGSGTYVTSSDIDQISIKRIRDISTEEESPYEILEVRKMIEPELVLLAVENATESHIKEIGEALRRMKEEIEINGRYSMENDTLFHMKIAEATGNALLFKVMRYIMDLIHERMWVNIIDGPDVVESDIKYDLEFHEGIYTCIKNRDRDNVRPVMIKRFSEIQKRIG